MLWPSGEQKSNFAVIGFHLSSRQTDTTELAKLSWNWPAGASAVLLGPLDMQATHPLLPHQGTLMREGEKDVYNAKTDVYSISG